MKKEQLNITAAIERGRTQPYALIRSISSFSLGPTPATLPPTEELLEARFFSEQGEYRIFHNGTELAAVYLTEEPDDEYIESDYTLENDKSQRIYVRQIIGYDEDGQAVLHSGRLIGWKEEKDHG